MRFGKRDALSIIGIGVAALLTFFVVKSGFHVATELSRSTRLDVSQPLGKLTAVDNYWGIYMRLLLAQQGYGEPMFKNLPCHWGPLAGLGELPINDKPDMPLYIIPADFLAYYGYAGQYATLSAMGLSLTLLCIEHTNGTWCDCDLDVAYPTPEEFVNKNVFQGNEYKYNDKTVMASVWFEEDGKVVNADGSDKIPQCARKGSKRSSLTKSYTIKFANFYVNIKVCTGSNYKPNARFTRALHLFISLSAILGALAAFYCIVCQSGLVAMKVSPSQKKFTNEEYDTIETTSPKVSSQLNAASLSN